MRPAEGTLAFLKSRGSSSPRTQTFDLGELRVFLRTEKSKKKKKNATDGRRRTGGDAINKDNSSDPSLRSTHTRLYDIKYLLEVLRDTQLGYWGTDGEVGKVGNTVKWGGPNTVNS